MWARGWLTRWFQLTSRQLMRSIVIGRVGGWCYLLSPLRNTTWWWWRPPECVPRGCVPRGCHNSNERIARLICRRFCQVQLGFGDRFSGDGGGGDGLQKRGKNVRLIQLIIFGFGMCLVGLGLSINSFPPRLVAQGNCNQQSVRTVMWGGNLWVWRYAGGARITLCPTGIGQRDHKLD